MILLLKRKGYREVVSFLLTQTFFGISPFPTSMLVYMYVQISFVPLSFYCIYYWQGWVGLGAYPVNAREHLAGVILSFHQEGPGD